MGKQSGPKGSTSISSSGPTRTGRKAQKEQLEATSPILVEISRQIMEALRTGGVGARIPIQQRTTESAMKAVSDALRNVTEGVARSGVGQYGRGLVEGVRGAGGMAVSQASLAPILELIGHAPDYGLLRGSPMWSTSSGISKSSGGGGAFGIDLSGLVDIGRQIGRQTANNTTTATTSGSGGGGGSGGWGGLIGLFSNLFSGSSGGG